MKRTKLALLSILSVACIGLISSPALSAAASTTVPPNATKATPAAATLVATPSYKSSLLEFKDVADAYFCKAIVMNLEQEAIDSKDYVIPPSDPQSKLVEDQCKNYVEANPEIRELSLEELSYALSRLIEGEDRKEINLTLRSLQDDFLAAEGVYPRAPQVIWSATSRLLKDLSASLAVHLEDQNQRLTNGKSDLLLQALHGAFIVMSVTKGGQIGYKTVRSGIFGWKTLGPDYASQTVRSMNLALRGFGDTILRTPKNLWIMVTDTATGAKTLTLKSLSALGSPLQSMKAAGPMIVKGASGAYAGILRSASENKRHLQAGALGGVSYAVYRYMETNILDPEDFLNEAIVATFDQMHNEWTLLDSISKMTKAAELEKAAKDSGLTAKEDLAEVWGITQMKYTELRQIAKGRNLNLPFQLMQNTLEESYEKIKALAPPKVLPKKAPTPENIEEEKPAPVKKDVPKMKPWIMVPSMPYFIPTFLFKSPEAPTTPASPVKAGETTAPKIDVGTQPAVAPSKVVTSPDASAKGAKGAGNNSKTRN